MSTLLRVICLSLVTLLIWAQNASACSCEYAGTFGKFSEGQTVIRGMITGYGPKLDHGETLYATMTVSVVEIINGSYAHRTVQFKGDPGHLCLTYVNSNRYLIGSEHMFVLFSDEKKQGLMGCGEVSVSITDGQIHGSGYVDDEWTNYSVGYDEFVVAIKE